MPSVNIEYPIWFVIFCLSLGFLYAFFLYRKDKKFVDTPKYFLKILFGLRFFTVSVISFLLLSPILKLTGKIIEKPLILYIVDNSASMSAEKEKLFVSNEKIINFFQNNKTYDLKQFTFGENIRKGNDITLDEKLTDLDKALKAMNSGFYRRNLAAVIIAGDGIYNSGNNPEYASKEIPFPIYTIAYGDTVIKPDRKITQILSNKTAFLNNKFPVKVNVSVDLLKNKKFTVNVYVNGILKEKRERIATSDHVFSSLDFELIADKPGFLKIKAEILADDQEFNIKNNEKQLIVEVLDSKQKILILADAPHPDIAAFREALDLNQNFETDFFLIDRFNQNIQKYQLIVFHQLPSISKPASEIVSQITKTGIPVLYILGNNSSIEKFNLLNTGLSIEGNARKKDEVYPIYNKNFDLFPINPDLEELLVNTPPLLSPFGEYSTSSNAKTLFYRKIKNIATESPLMVFNSDLSGNKTAVIAGEGIWLWRIYDFKQNSNHYIFNELINNTVQFLTLKETKDRLMIHNDHIFTETQAVTFKAEVYDKDYKTLNNCLIQLKITDSEKNEYMNIFENKSNYYSLTTKKFPEGDYFWIAETTVNGEKYKKEGMFMVVAQNMEYENLTANHNILNKMSKNSGGKLFYPDQTNELLQTIKTNENIVPVAYSEKKSNNMINFKLIFFLLLLMLSSEWFLRKFFGAY